MAAARKTRPAPGLRERAAATKASVEKVIRQEPQDDQGRFTAEASTPPAASIAAQLIELSRQFEQFDDIAFEADDVRGITEGGHGGVSHRVIDLAETHAKRRCSELLQVAMELPATNILELGLQARFVAREMNEWWGSKELNTDERACRILLTRLIALAGLERMYVPDVSSDELLGWLRDPETKGRQLYPEGLPKTAAAGARS